MIRIDAIWLALGASDLRAGMDTLLARVVQCMQGGARSHTAYVFANRGATCLKVLVYDGAGLWLCTRRLQSGRFVWPQGEPGVGTVAICQRRLNIEQKCILAKSLVKACL